MLYSISDGEHHDAYRIRHGHQPALANARTSLEDLKVLRDHATAVVAAQGDLKGGLAKLNKEIKAREAKLKKK